MTTQQRRTTHEERGEWVVDAATGRVMRRETATAQLLHQVASALGEGMQQAAMNLEPRESDLRVIRAVEDSRTVTSVGSMRYGRSSAAHASPDGKATNRQNWGE